MELENVRRLFVLVEMKNKLFFIVVYLFLIVGFINFVYAVDDPKYGCWSENGKGPMVIHERGYCQGDPINVGGDCFTNTFKTPYGAVMTNEYCCWNGYPGNDWTESEFWTKTPPELWKPKQLRGDSGENKACCEDNVESRKEYNGFIGNNICCDNEFYFAYHAPDNEYNSICCTYGFDVNNIKRASPYAASVGYVDNFFKAACCNQPYYGKAGSIYINDKNKVGIYVNFELPKVYTSAVYGDEESSVDICCNQKWGNKAMGDLAGSNTYYSCCGSDDVNARGVAICTGTWTFNGETHSDSICCHQPEYPSGESIFEPSALCGNDIDKKPICRTNVCIDGSVKNTCTIGKDCDKGITGVFGTVVSSCKKIMS